MNINKTTLVLLLSSFTLPSIITAGASKQDVCVSAQRIMAESETGKALQAKLQSEQEKQAKPLQDEDKKVQAKRKELIDTQEKIEASKVEFNKSAKTMSEADKAKKIETLQDQQQKFEDGARELERMMQKLQAKAKEVEAKMQQLYQTEMNKFDALVKEVIKELAVKNNWGMVFMAEQLLYFDPSKDKTKEVIAALDAKSKAQAQAKKQALEAKPASKL